MLNCPNQFLIMSHDIPPNELGMVKEIQSNNETKKICFVPDCPNTSTTTPKKVFLSVPGNPLKHELWCSVIETPEKQAKRTKYCCEDHFDLQKYLENYWEWRLTGANERLRQNVVPRRSLNFEDTQPDLPGPTLDAVSPEDNSSSLSLLDDAVIYCLSNKVDRSTQSEVDVEDKQVQAKVAVYSKRVQTSITGSEQRVRVKVDIGIQCDIGALRSNDLLVVTSGVDNLKVSVDELNETVDSISSNVLDTATSYEPSTEQTSTSQEKKLKLSLIKQDCYVKFTKLMIEDDPYMFIGVRKDTMYVLEALQDMSSISQRDVYLVLKKIRLNQPFKILAYEFSISESQASRIFQKNVDLMAEFFKQIIIWPSKKHIRMNLPIPFRYRYSDVESIIDCLEIEVEKPSDAMNQSLAWSEYKHCNTDKRLISITADGLINFVSKGVCGRCTDMSIAKNCGYLEKIPAGTSVLADRGFKQLDVLLQEKNCTLVRPPSVQKDTKSSKSDVHLTKQVASLRIHVERVINRIRNFDFLNIHTRTDNKLIRYLDSVMYIVCGLVNLDTPVIKQSDD